MELFYILFGKILISNKPFAFNTVIDCAIAFFYLNWSIFYFKKWSVNALLLFKMGLIWWIFCWNPCSMAMVFFLLNTGFDTEFWVCYLNCGLCFLFGCFFTLLFPAFHGCCFWTQIACLWLIFSFFPREMRCWGARWSGPTLVRLRLLLGLISYNLELLSLVTIWID